MALSDFYKSTIIKVEAHFGFAFFDINPNEIGKILKIRKAEILIKGNLRPLKNGKSIINTFNSWNISSKSKSKDINIHLRQLLKKVLNKRGLFRKEFGEPSFNVLWKGNYLYAGSGPFLEADVVKGIAALKAKIFFDIYQID